MILPIDIIPGSTPPRFKWKQVMGTPLGQKTFNHEGVLPANVEQAVMALVVLAKHMVKENMGLRSRVTQLETDGKTALDAINEEIRKQEQAPRSIQSPPMPPIKKGKG